MRSLATAAAAAPALIGLLYQSRTVSGLKDYDPELYINDERAQIQTMYTSTTGMVIPMVSGSLSAISSMITIYLINKSWKKLTTVYHRIMFALSLCDIIMSVAIALAPATAEGYDLSVPKYSARQYCNLQRSGFLLHLWSHRNIWLQRFSYDILSMFHPVQNDRAQNYKTRGAMAAFCVSVV